MAKSAAGVVYWLYDERCVCIWRHGYIGVTVTLERRLWRHRNEPRTSFLPDQFEGQVLFRGHIKHCLALEKKLRPTPGIGWNRLPGGLAGHATKGVPKSPEQREKMRQAALKRYADPAEHERTARAVKKGLKGIDRSGSNNSNFGKPVSEETKEKMRQRIVERGGVDGQNNPNYKHGRYSDC